MEVPDKTKRASRNPGVSTHFPSSSLSSFLILFFSEYEKEARHYFSSKTTQSDRKKYVLTLISRNHRSSFFFFWHKPKKCTRKGEKRFSHFDWSLNSPLLPEKDQQRARLWKNEQVTAWLSGAGLDSLVPLFQEIGVDGDQFVDFNPDDLDARDVSPEVKAKFKVRPPILLPRVQTGHEAHGLVWFSFFYPQKSGICSDHMDLG